MNTDATSTMRKEHDMVFEVLLPGIAIFVVYLLAAIAGPIVAKWWNT